MEKLLGILLEDIGLPAGIAIFVCVLFIKYLAPKWLEKKFAKELEELKFKINSLFDRVTKIHEKEFEVLPIAWEKLDDLLDLISKFLRETHYIPDLNNKSPQELEEFLSKQGFNEEEKRKVRDQNDKNLWYFHVRSEKVADACLDFQNYIAKKGIFLSSDIKNKFEEAEKTIREVWAVRDTAEASADRNKGIIEACKIIQEKMPPMMDIIEELVQKRLRFPEA